MPTTTEETPPLLHDRGTGETSPGTRAGRQLLNRAISSSTGLDAEGPGAAEMENELLRRGYTRAEAQRAVAHQQMRAAMAGSILAGLAGCSCFLWVMILFGCLAGPVVLLVLYLYGWAIFLHHTDEPCDQPLGDWLGAYLSYTVLVTCGRQLLLKVLCAWSQEYEDGVPLPAPGRVKVFNAVVPLVSLSWMIFAQHLIASCKTCKKTNPQLYDFVSWYSWAVLFLYALWCFIGFGLAGSLIWLARNGYLSTKEAASPDTINKMKTFPYDPNSFADPQDPSDTRPLPECCICLCEYDAEKEIKITACDHVMHKECLESWLKTSRQCPLCRKDLEQAHNPDAAPSREAGDVETGGRGTGVTGTS